VVVYASVGYFFANKMVRLVLLMGPIASCLGGIALGACAEWCVWQAALFVPSMDGDDEEEGEQEDDKEGKKEREVVEEPSPKKGKKRGPTRGLLTQYQKEQLRASVTGLLDAFRGFYEMVPIKLVRLILVVWLGYTARKYADDFSNYCNQLAVGMSNPSLVFKAHLNNGQVGRHARTRTRTHTHTHTRLFSEREYAQAYATRAPTEMLAMANEGQAADTTSTG
jgi:dolichyl-diphosphooligosaccharide--protein glycosyltransferase